MDKMKINFIALSLIATLALTGCGSGVKGKIYLSSGRFGEYGEPGEKRLGTCVYQNGRVKKLYRYQTFPKPTRDGVKLIANTIDPDNIIKMVDLKTGKTRDLKFPHSASGFSWFPDNKKIACSGGTTLNRFDYIANIYIMDLETMQEEQITFYKDVNRRIFDIDVSPDGKYILYSIKNAEKNDYGTSVRIINLKTKEDEALPFSATTFDWSPDSKTIVLYGIYSYKGEKEYGPRTIIYDVTTKEYTKLPVSTEDLGEAYYTFSPDGSKIAYVRHEKNGRHTMWTMNADGTNRKKILDDGYQLSNLTWTK
ncbi:MAG: hypothetical protein DRP85_00025 [Candidatus Makaraimicrobium thalassicum]|nr:MAG: hypothetical protein DRP85_00025 [Candidatus Omnitrophota bacterium]